MLSSWFFQNIIKVPERILHKAAEKKGKASSLSFFPLLFFFYLFLVPFRLISFFVYYSTLISMHDLEIFNLPWTTLYIFSRFALGF